MYYSIFLGSTYMIDIAYIVHIVMMNDLNRLNIFFFGDRLNQKRDATIYLA